MSDRTVRVVLRAENGQYKKAMGEAAKATEQLSTSTEKVEKSARKASGTIVTVGEYYKETGEKGQSAFSRMLDSAEQNHRAWDVTGKVMLSVGAATAAMGIAALKTGVQYNTLQQTSRAALTTMLGGVKQANAQMDELDNFARTSPFAKQVFIQAQQQMLGFRIEASKVLPYLDAIENAVAATGGSNQDIAELSRIFSQINATAKITAQDLNQLGTRGIDAASLIGEQMGKTGAQIRDEITAGTLDARQALDALAEGMAATFDGAAAGVKDTFVGAFDRVKGAWRDFSAELARPLVDPNGGGALVDLLNWAADMMRAFERLPGPIKGTATTVAGLVTAVSLLGGAFALLLPKIAAARTRLKTFAATSTAAGTAVKALGITAGVAGAAIAAGAIAFTIWATKSAEAEAAISSFRDTLDEVGKTTDDTTRLMVERLASGTDSWVDGMTTYIELADKMGIASEDLIGHILGEASARERNTAAMEQYRKEDSFFGKILTKRSTETGQLVSKLDQMAGQLTEAQKRELEAARAAEATGVAQDDLGESIDGTTDALQDQERAFEEWRKMVESASGSFISLTDSFQAVIDKNREVAEEAAVASGEAKSSWEDFYDGTTVKMKDWIAELEAQAEAQANWRDNILKVTAEIRDQMPADMAAAAHAMVDELIAAGPQGAAALQAFADASPKQRARLVEAWRGTGADIAAEIESARNPIIQIEADGTIAERELSYLLAEIGDAEGTVSVEGDIGPASAALGMLTATIDEADGTVTIYGEDGEAVTTLSNYVADVDASDGTVTILGEDKEGRATVVSLTGWIGDQEPEVKVKADISDALKELRLFRSEAAKDVTTTVNGRVVHDFAKSGAMGDGEGAGWSGSTPRGVSQMTAATRSLDPSARITSGYRPGARTATGFPSYHGMGRAIDIVSPNMGRTFDLLRQAFGSKAKELYYSPRGFIRNGRWTNDVAAVTRRMHYNHVHLALKDGGSVRGPGTGTSDSIPAWLSNGEHVWTKREVDAAGGHAAVEQMRRAVMGQAQAFAQGGAVGSANRALQRAIEQRNRARDAAKAARADVRAAQRAEEAAKSDKRREVLAKRTADAEKRLAQAEDRLSERRSAVDEQRARRDRLRDERRDLRVDVRRGNIQDSVTGSLSGAYGVVDSMRDLARSGDLTKAQSNRLMRAARAEGDLRRLYRQAERIEAKLADARDRVTELTRISDGVRDKITGGFSLVGSSVTNPWTGKQELTGQTAKSAVQGYAQKAQAFARKLQTMQRRGFSGVILQEVAMAGVEEGTVAADALLSLNAADRRAVNKAYEDIDRAAGQAGQFVSEGFFRGGVAAAEGIVKGLESQQGKVERQIMRIAMSMEKALKRALGIQSPSRVFRRLMSYVGQGAVLGLADQEQAVAGAAGRMFDQVKPSKVAASNGFIPATTGHASASHAATGVRVEVQPMSREDIQFLGDYIVESSGITAGRVSKQVLASAARQAQAHMNGGRR